MNFHVRDGLTPGGSVRWRGRGEARFREAVVVKNVQAM